MILLQLLFSFLQIGLFSIGGGYAAIPLIRQQTVEMHHWLLMEEFTDLVSIAEMTPGPLAVNAATFVGIRVAGLPGALIATLGCILPGAVLSGVLAYFYYRFKKQRTLQLCLQSLRPAVVALIASAGISVVLLALFGKTVTAWTDLQGTQFDVLNLLLFVCSFLLLRKTKCPPVLLMLACGLICLCSAIV